MSIESAKAFLERVRNDEEFNKELVDRTSAEERIKFVKAQGFDFTKEEMNAVQEELSDEELEGVTGGKLDIHCCWGDCTAREVNQLI